MRVIRSESVLNDRGQPATIGIIGSCRVHGPVQQLAARGDLTILACPFNSYSLTVLEAYRYIDFCLGRMFIQPAFASIVFGRDKIVPISRPFIELVESIDLFVVEISSLMRLSACGLEMQSNYFSTNLIRAGGRAYLDWWRAVTLNSSERIDVAEKLINDLRESSPGGIEPWREELLLTTRYGEMDDSVFCTAMRQLVASHPARFLFVTHFDLPGEDTMEIRRKISNRVGRYCDTNGIPWFDPSPLVAERGRTEALKGGGKDIYHYEDTFETTVGEHLIRHCTKAMKTPSQAGTGAPAEHASELRKRLRPAELYEMRTEDLRTLLEQEPALPDSARDLAARRILESDPNDDDAALLVARIALARDMPETALIYANQVVRRSPANKAATEIRFRAMMELGAGDHEAHLDEAIARGDLQSLARACNMIRSHHGTGTPLRQRVEDLVAERAGRIDRLETAGKLAEACRQLTELQQLVPGDSRELKRRADELHRTILADLRDLTLSERHVEAAALARTMVTARLSLSTAYDTLGRTALANGDLDAAENAFRLGIGESENEGVFHLNLARTLVRKGEIIEAAKSYRRARDMLRETSKTEAHEDACKSLRSLATPLVRKAREMEAEAGQFEDFLECYRCFELAAAEMNREVLDGWTANLRRRSLLEVLRLHREAPESFEDAARIYLEIAPEDCRILGMLAHFISSDRRHEEAIPIWERLLEIEPANASAHVQVARCYEWLAMREPMRQAAERALELDPANEAARELLSRAPQTGYADED